MEEDNFVNNVYADAFSGYELKSSESNNDRDVTDSDTPVQFERRDIGIMKKAGGSLMTLPTSYIERSNIFLHSRACIINSRSSWHSITDFYTNYVFNSECVNLPNLNYTWRHGVCPALAKSPLILSMVRLSGVESATF